ncbi:MAG: hypothetical protein GF344_03255 [Chitinivibrionales bacterium]|nr:hypothetical protein [Chitinivibrionales bacterium]MBD3356095.1 hypothetical protein [Chitinivibrionales bacterium]
MKYTTKHRPKTMRPAPKNFSAVTIILVCLGCGESEQVSGTPRVFVTIPQQAELVRLVAGDVVDVHTLLPAGQSPHSFSPTARQMTALAEASSIFVSALNLRRS